MNYYDLISDLLKELDIKEVNDVLNDYHSLVYYNNMNMVTIDYLTDLYNKYKDDIEYLNSLRTKINENEGRQYQNKVIRDSNQIKDTTNLMLEYLVRIAILKYLRQEANEEIKNALPKANAKVLYDLFVKIIEKK